MLCGRQGRRLASERRKASHFTVTLHTRRICSRQWWDSPRVVFVISVSLYADVSSMLIDVAHELKISCCMACPAEFEHGYTSGVYTTTANRTACDHLVTVIGFGGADDDSYWTVQNSFGTVWGEGGYFRIKRNSALHEGEHNLGIEHACSWVMPKMARH